jgi:hypothetical protein
VHRDHARAAAFPPPCGSAVTFPADLKPNVSCRDEILTSGTRRRYPSRNRGPSVCDSPHAGVVPCRLPENKRILIPRESHEKETRPVSGPACRKTHAQRPSGNTTTGNNRRHRYILREECREFIDACRPYQTAALAILDGAFNGHPNCTINTQSNEKGLRLSPQPLDFHGRP